MSSQIVRGIRGQRGVTAIVVAIVLPILIGFVALAVDVGFVAMTKNELQNIADATSLAGAGKLGKIYKDLSSEQQQSYVCGGQDLADIRAVITDVASKNKAGGMGSISINISDIIIGTWEGKGNDPDPTPIMDQPDAVKVTVRRDSAANGPITTFFARIFGINTADVEADATAALGSQAEAEPGEIELPVGISSFWFSENLCNDEITFYPAQDSCSGWTTFEQEPSNPNAVIDILNNQKTPSDTVYSGETSFNFTGGTIKPIFGPLLDRFQVEGDDVSSLDGDYPHPTVSETGDPPIPLFVDGERLLYNDGTPRNYHEWETAVVVYDSTDCKNPNQSKVVVGFARIVMFDVLNVPEKLIKAIVICEVYDSEATRSGGGRYGVKGTIPRLVE